MAQLSSQLEEIAAAQRNKAKELQSAKSQIRHTCFTIFEERELSKVIFDTATCLTTSKDVIHMYHYANGQNRDLASKLKEYV